MNVVTGVVATDAKVDVQPRTRLVLLVCTRVVDGVRTAVFFLLDVSSDVF